MGIVVHSKNSASINVSKLYKTVAIGVCPLAMKWNITTQLCMCVAVYDLLTALLALELALAK